ncbi:L,D-transpeptidase catalytic domain [Nitrosomonas cryotolerans]|uniref:L,D-transpeptidase catalytic domain n=1 Tax=Nitrosomonas cryotolerans ATCC 49181 TaxID=1131553 RepID=A0A1N6IY29_9PROT|nr:L,D-transpeptidase [Nitrosomonas cryotolerans]SFQ01599.1 L,D-transpeptidase catalytic domain [Nitrosomonas cryotolerans]SIO36911.1 L,D-transpeptidase catalytic domain [Nitrosomonas cryotolerans ATCC 49181]
MKININIASQQLDLLDDNGNIIRQCLISSARNGVGQKKDSFCTPLGMHVIRAKVGQDQPINTVFIRRRPTGEIYTSELGERYPKRDWILTRILWLSGCEHGFNRLGLVDTMRRYIYIHGSPDSVKMGKPGSIGCIRMHNHDLLTLFDEVDVGTRVEIRC